MKSVSRFLFARPADRAALLRCACVAAGLAFGTQSPFYGAIGVALSKPRLVMKAHHLVLAGFNLRIDAR